MDPLKGFSETIYKKVKPKMFSTIKKRYQNVMSVKPLFHAALNVFYDLISLVSLSEQFIHWRSL